MGFNMTPHIFFCNAVINSALMLLRSWKTVGFRQLYWI